MAPVLPHPPLLLLATHDPGEEAGVPRVFPQEGEVRRGVGGREPGSDQSLELQQVVGGPERAAQGGDVAGVVRGEALLLRQVGAPLGPQAVQGEETDLVRGRRDVSQ